MVQLDNGLDEHGYVRNVYSSSHIQAEFKAVVDAAVNELTTKFPNQIDEYYRWQFWLKHCCCCVWSNVLRPVFGIILIMLRSLEESMMWRLVIQYHLTMRSTFLSGLASF